MIKIIKNAYVVDKEKEGFFDILIENGKILEVSKNINVDKDVEIIDAFKKIVMPSFIDLHVHFRDPGFTYKEDLKTGSLAALRGGFTTVNTMANTNPICDSLEIYEDIMKRQKDLNLLDINQIVAVTKNFDGKNLTDFEKFKFAKFFSDDGKAILSEKTMYEALLKAKKYNKIIMLHEESEISKIDYRFAEDLMTLRDIYLCEKLLAKAHFCHVSTKDSINAIRDAKKRGVKITCEVTPHHIALFNNSYKVHPPIREKLDVKALICAIKDGTVDAIATDHAPHSKEDKEKGSPGLVGLESAFCVSYTTLVKENNVDIKTLSRLLSYFPASFMGIKKGLIKKGYIADLVIVDVDKKVKIESEKFLSKSKNTPFDKMEFFGEVLMTIKDGEIKYKK